MLACALPHVRQAVQSAVAIQNDNVTASAYSMLLVMMSASHLFAANLIEEPASKGIQDLVQDVQSRRIRVRDAYSYLSHRHTCLQKPLLQVCPWAASVHLIVASSLPLMAAGPGSKVIDRRMTF